MLPYILQRSGHNLRQGKAVQKGGHRICLQSFKEGQNLSAQTSKSHLLVTKSIPQILPPLVWHFNIYCYYTIKAYDEWFYALTYLNMC